MSFAGPILVIVGPALAALITVFLGRWRRLAAVAGLLLTLWLWLTVVSLPLNPTSVERANRMFAGDTFFILGRSLLLTEGIRSLFLFLYAGLSLLILLSLLFPQGARFVPGCLAALSPLSVSLMIRPLTFGALSLLVTATVLVLVLQADRVGSTQTALRYLTLMLLAVPPILLAGWMLGGDRVTLLRPASRLMLIGFAVLLAGFPFHIWVRPIVSDSPPLVSVYLFGLVQLAVTVFIFNILQEKPSLLEDVFFSRALRQSGTATVVVAALLALTAADFKRLLESLLLFSLGMSILALTLAGQAAWRAALTMQIARFLSLVVVGLSLVIWQRYGLAGATAVKSSFRGRAPFSIALFVYGCLSLIGLPLTPGFIGQWTVINASELALRTPWLPYLPLLAMIGAMIGLFRRLAPLLAKNSDEAAERTFIPEPWLEGLSALALLFGLWMAVFPKTWVGYVLRLADLLR